MYNFFFCKMLVSCITVNKSPVCFFKNVTYFIIDFIQLLVLPGALFVLPLVVSGRLADNKTGKRKEHTFK